MPVAHPQFFRQTHVLKFCVAAMMVAVGALSACRKDPAVALAQHMKRGDDLATQGKRGEAILEYRLAVQANPRSGEARLKLADAYLKNKDTQNAFGEYVRAADLMPENTDAQLKAGQILLMAGQFEDAKTRADKILASHPDHVEAQILRGNALAGLKDMDGAIAEVENAIRSDPSRSLTYSSLGTLQLAKGDQIQAEAAFKKAVSANPKSVPALLALANLYWATNRKAEAEKAVQASLALEPKNELSNRALAILYIGSGRSAEAEGPLKVIAEVVPGPEGRLALADYYTAAQRMSEAKAVLEKLAQEPDGATPAKLRLAYLGMAGGNRTEARRLVDEILAKEPKRGDALIAKAQLQMADGKLTDAVATSRSAVAAAPGSTQAHFVLGTLLSATGHDDEAMDAQKEALRVNPRFAPAATELARLSIIAGKYSEAVQLAQSAIEAAPGYPKAHLMLARAQMANGNPSGAEVPLKLLSANFPKEPVVQAEVGRLLLTKGDRAGARATFERVLATDPLQVSALEGLTQLDVEQKKIGPAHARIDAAAAAGPKNPGLQVVAARAYVMLGDNNAAERSLKLALATDPNKLDAYDLLARLYVSEHKLPEATVEFGKQAELRPKDVSAQTAVAILLELQHKPDEAKARYEKALAVDSHAAVAANNLAQLYADRNENLDTALQLAQTAKAGLPKSPEVDDTLGWVYYKKGLSTLAIEALKQSAAADPQNASYLYHLGLAYKQNGDRFLARQTLEKALKLQPDFSGADDARKALASVKG